MKTNMCIMPLGTMWALLALFLPERGEALRMDRKMDRDMIKTPQKFVKDFDGNIDLDDSWFHWFEFEMNPR